jgi:hypothetical protein
LGSISYFDSAESFYHGFLLGLLKGIRHFMFQSNRESGLGRSDIVMKFRTPLGQAVIFEFKFGKSINQLGSLCQKALSQINDNKYDAELLEEGYSPEKILKYGIAFCGKVCRVECGD